MPRLLPDPLDLGQDVRPRIAEREEPQSGFRAMRKIYHSCDKSFSWRSGQTTEWNGPDGPPWGLRDGGSPATIPCLVPRIEEVSPQHEYGC